MAYKDNSGINLGSNFTYKSHAPLDSRHLPANKADLDDILTSGSYAGMPVYLDGIDGYASGVYFYNPGTAKLDPVMDSSGNLLTFGGVPITSWVNSLLNQLTTGELKELQDDLAAEIKSREDLEKEFDTLNETHTARLEGLEKFQEDTSTWKTTHDTEYAEYKASVDQAQKTQNQNITDVTSKANTNAQNITSIQTTIGADDSAGLRKRIATNEGDIDALQEALGELDGNVAEKLQLHTKQFAMEETSALLEKLQQIEDSLTWQTFE